jgi:hypothetical protein
MSKAFPLRWPPNWKRTPKDRRTVNYSWKGTPDKYRRALLDEIRRLNGREVIVSTNVELRQDGSFYAGAPIPGDPGVAVYFVRGEKKLCFACDKYSRVEWNAHAIGLTIAAMRQIERCGASDMLDRAFTGFAALPQNVGRPWREVLGITLSLPTFAHVEEKFREAARLVHPDVGGSEAKMQELNVARDQARAELKP